MTLTVIIALVIFIGFLIYGIIDFAFWENAFVGLGLAFVVLAVGGIIATRIGEILGPDIHEYRVETYKLATLPDGKYYTLDNSRNPNYVFLAEKDGHYSAEKVNASCAYIADSDGAEPYIEVVTSIGFNKENQHRHWYAVPSSAWNRTIIYVPLGVSE